MGMANFFITVIFALHMTCAYIGTETCLLFSSLSPTLVLKSNRGETFNSISRKNNIYININIFSLQVQAGRGNFFMDSFWLLKFSILYHVINRSHVNTFLFAFWFSGINILCFYCYILLSWWIKSNLSQAMMANGNWKSINLEGANIQGFSDTVYEITKYSFLHKLVLYLICSLAKTNW